MIEIKAFNSVVASALKSYNYKRSGSCWLKSSEEVSVVLQFQKSNYDKQVYLNVGFNIRTLGGSAECPPSRCHLYARIEDVIGPSGDLLELFDLCSRSLSSDVHGSSVDSYLRSDLLPKLELFLDVRYLGTRFAEGAMDQVAMTRDALDHLRQRDPARSRGRKG